MFAWLACNSRKLPLDSLKGGENIPDISKSGKHAMECWQDIKVELNLTARGPPLSILPVSLAFLESSAVVCYYCEPGWSFSHPAIRWIITTLLVASNLFFVFIFSANENKINEIHFSSWTLKRISREPSNTENFPEQVRQKNTTVCFITQGSIVHSLLKDQTASRLQSPWSYHLLCLLPEGVVKNHSRGTAG